LEQDETKLVPIEVFVKRHDPIRESREFAEQLHTYQSAADNHQGKQPAFPFGIGFHVGALQTLNEVIAKQESVGQRLESEGMLRARDHDSIGHGPESQDQLVVA
jgi:hypothetical protein